MAKVLLLSTTPADDVAPYNLAPLHALRESARIDRSGNHQLTDDPAAADVIVFAEAYGGGWHFERVRRHPFVGAFREKCFVVCSNPFVIPFIPGVYTSVSRRWSSGRTRSGFYPAQQYSEFQTFTAPNESLRYLYSFVGAIENAAVRRRISALRHRRGVFRDTTAEYNRYLHRDLAADEREGYHRAYAETIRASKFVLCPRGLSVSSIRLYETMRMGRVPVILSDGWVPPVGPRWERFALRVAERDVPKLPRLLEEREGDAVAMGLLARAQWEEWFSEEVAFRRVVDWCISIRDERVVPESLARWPVYLQYLRPFHFRRLVRRKLTAAAHSVALTCRSASVSFGAWGFRPKPSRSTSS